MGTAAGLGSHGTLCTGSHAPEVTHRKARTERQAPNVRNQSADNQTIVNRTRRRNDCAVKIASLGHL